MNKPITGVTGSGRKIKGKKNKYKTNSWGKATRLETETETVKVEGKGNRLPSVFCQKDQYLSRNSKSESVVAKFGMHVYSDCQTCFSHNKLLM